MSQPVRPSRPRAGLARLALGLAGAAGAAGAACSDSGTTGLGSGETPQQFQIVAAAGAASLPGLAGRTLSMAPGDTARLAGVLSDGKGGGRSVSGLTWSIGDPTIADVDVTGLVRAKGGGTTTLVAQAAQRADTISLIVSACGSVPTISLAVGQVTVYGGGQGADLCALGGTTGGEYALIAYNTDSANIGAANSGSGAKTTSVTVSGTGLAEIVANASASALDRAATLAPRPPARDGAFDLALRRRAVSELRGRLAGLQAARARGATAGRTTGATGTALRSAAAAPLTVGQLVTLNTGMAPCDTTAPNGLNRRTGRVVTITDRAIVVADTGNPAGGFTDTQYRAYAVAFDTLAYPVDVANFGDPQDVDKNGKSIIFFTRAVNAMTPRNADYYVGGFFYERDLFPNTFGLSEKDGGCGGSNYAEMFYMLVPDPNGTINGNRRTLGFVDSMTVGTLGHEFQHLINASRRVFVNDADDWEDVWLNEGLSHVAEELIFDRAGGVSPRTRMTSDAIRATDRTRTAFNVYGKGNFERLLTYLDAPEANSPYSDDDELETRGATWQFLRYAADRLNGDDTQLWRKLVATTKLAGHKNLQAAFGLSAATLGDWYRDFAIANYADGLASGVSASYAYRSWDFRNVIGGFKTTRGTPAYPVYPLYTRALAAGFSQTAQVRGGAAAYFRFAIAPNRQATLKTRGASAAAAMGSTVRLAIVRVK